MQVLVLLLSTLSLGRKDPYVGVVASLDCAPFCPVMPARRAGSGGQPMLLVIESEGFWGAGVSLS